VKANAAGLERERVHELPCGAGEPLLEEPEAAADDRREEVEAQSSASSSDPSIR
jgi:hypothetical protein